MWISDNCTIVNLSTGRFGNFIYNSVNLGLPSVLITEYIAETIIKITVIKVVLYLNFGVCPKIKAKWDINKYVKAIENIPSQM